MIEFSSFSLDNGLKVIVHEDQSVHIATLNILYDVGSKDEHSEKTGFAHLFEHLMFGGSKNIKNFDSELQRVGGENNAFTSPDITNYYLTVPSQNIETGFWLESDRMLGLSFDPKVLEVQRGVVIEEFHQRYLNQPYGDAWLKLRPLAYKEHPYKWATIGKEIGHIEKATMDDVRGFFETHYAPNRATLVVAGNVTVDQIKKLSQKWFGPIQSRSLYQRSLPIEPPQTEKRELSVEAPVPSDSLNIVYHMPGKFDDEYYTADLLSDILGRGESSRLYRKLVKESEIFNSIGAHVTGSIDPGLLVINGKLNKEISMESARKAVGEVIAEVIDDGVDENELQKVKNQAESSLVFSQMGILNRAMNLSMAELSGDANLVNEELDKILAVSSDGIKAMSKQVLSEENSSTLYYKSNLNKV